MNCFQTTFLAASPTYHLLAVHTFISMGYLFIGTVFKCFIKNNSCNPHNNPSRRYYYYLSHKEVKKLVPGAGSRIQPTQPGYRVAL